MRWRPPCIGIPALMRTPWRLLPRTGKSRCILAVAAIGGIVTPGSRSRTPMQLPRSASAGSCAGSSVEFRSTLQPHAPQTAEALAPT